MYSSPRPAPFETLLLRCALLDEGIENNLALLRRELRRSGYKQDCLARCEALLLMRMQAERSGTRRDAEKQHFDAKRCLILRIWPCMWHMSELSRRNFLTAYEDDMAHPDEARFIHLERNDDGRVLNMLVATSAIPNGSDLPAHAEVIDVCGCTGADCRNQVPGHWSPRTCDNIRHHTCPLCLVPGSLAQCRARSLCQEAAQHTELERQRELAHVKSMPTSAVEAAAGVALSTDASSLHGKPKAACTAAPLVALQGSELCVYVSCTLGEGKFSGSVRLTGGSGCVVMGMTSSSTAEGAGLPVVIAAGKSERLTLKHVHAGLTALEVLGQSSNVLCCVQVEARDRAPLTPKLSLDIDGADAICAPCSDLDLASGREGLLFGTAGEFFPRLRTCCGTTAAEVQCAIGAPWECAFDRCGTCCKKVRNGGCEYHNKAAVAAAKRKEGGASASKPAAATTAAEPAAPNQPAPATKPAAAPPTAQSAGATQPAKRAAATAKPPSAVKRTATNPTAAPAAKRTAATAKPPTAAEPAAADKRAHVCDASDPPPRRPRREAADRTNAKIVDTLRIQGAPM